MGRLCRDAMGDDKDGHGSLKATEPVAAAGAAAKQDVAVEALRYQPATQARSRKGRANDSVHICNVASVDEEEDGPLWTYVDWKHRLCAKSKSNKSLVDKADKGHYPAGKEDGNRVAIMCLALSCACASQCSCPRHSTCLIPETLHARACVHTTKDALNLIMMLLPVCFHSA